MEVSIYEMSWIFMIYAFLGWCTEVCYVGLQKGRFVNRGFLNGPYCPVYGFGVLIIIYCLTPIKDNFFILFAGSVILTSILEFITGFLLKQLFHDQWWDYSDEPFNICGYICLKFSIRWGIGCLIIMDILHPVIIKTVMLLPKIVGIVILIIFFCGFAADCIVTVASISKFNKRLKLLEEIAEKLKVISDEIGENLFDKATEVKTYNDEVKENMEDRKVEGMQLLNRYKQLLNEKTTSHNRLIKAFPSMKPVGEKKQELLELIKKNIEEKMSNKQ